jgi:uncharacterized cupredoxin-like copper-binding protein
VTLLNFTVFLKDSSDIFVRTHRPSAPEGQLKKANPQMKKKATLLAVGAVAVAGISTGCGSSSSNSSAANPPAPVTTQAAAAASTSAGPVAVSLSEMKVVPAPESTKGGKVTFDVKNAGALPHEMVVIKTDKKADALGSGTKVPETGSVGETGDVAAGKSKTLSLTLKPGHYALICNIPGHYAAGMHADFIVS